MPANDSVKKENAVSRLIDTGKLKPGINSIIDAITIGASGKQPDTNKLKAAATDVLTTANAVLSDSAIAKMNANNNEPAVLAAKKTLITMRNGIGIRPAELDSMKKTVEQVAVKRKYKSLK
ncbi:MAG TPA: hypothetical protein VKR53_03800 [Puia sp.]|nr:hypothetical protein [Puia sp.]